MIYDEPLVYFQMEEFLTEQHQNELINLYENIGDFPIGASDITSLHYTNIGEAEEALNPLNDNIDNIKCAKDFLMYDKTTQKCMFPSRIDIFKHFLYSGGYNNLRESYEKLIQRLKVFINYQFLTDYKQYLNNNNNNRNDTDKYIRILYNIFEYKSLKESTRKICNNSNAFLLPYQTSLTLQIPGQTLPSHTDLPYFKYATRYSFPQWLLVVMQHSNLFNKQRIKEVQAVVYIHPWNITHNADIKMGGEFLLYDLGPDFEPKTININGKSAIFCDGPNTIHGTNIFMAHDKLYYDSNIMKKSTLQYLKYENDNKFWRLYVDNMLTNITYDWYNIRASISSRLWCFDSFSDAMNYDPYEISDDFSLEYVLNILKKDLIHRKIVNQNKINKMSSYELGLLLMEEYIKYPSSNSLFPSFINYCLIFRKLPQNTFINWIKSVICE